MPLYATEQQYRDWSNNQDVDLSPRQLARASRVVMLATVGASYGIDTSTSLPTDPTILAALREATLEVLDARAEDGEGLAGVQSASIGSVSFTFAASATLSTETGLPIEAHRALLAAGLVGGPVVVYG